MKKAKIMLTSIVVLAVIGGAVASKAKKNTFTILYSYDAAALKCDITSTFLQAQTTAPDEPGALPTFYTDAFNLPAASAADCQTFTLQNN